MTQPILPPRRAVEPTSPLAIVSLVLSLGFFVCGPFLSIPAIICGHVALSRIRRSGHTLGGEGLAIAGLVMGYAGLVMFAFMVPLLAAILLPALSRAREAAMRATCQNNLKQVGLCLMMYAGEHDGSYPSKLADLYPEFAKDLGIFVCPSSEDKMGDPGSIDDWSSYSYTAPPPKTSDASTAVCQDKNANHIPGGRNILYADGHVAFKRGP